MKIKFIIDSGSHLVFQNGLKNIPREDTLTITIPCKFKSSTYNTEGKVYDGNKYLPIMTCIRFIHKMYTFGTIDNQRETKLN